MDLTEETLATFNTGVYPTSWHIFQKRTTAMPGFFLAMTFIIGLVYVMRSMIVTILLTGVGALLILLRIFLWQKGRITYHSLIAIRPEGVVYQYTLSKKPLRTQSLWFQTIRTLELGQQANPLTYWLDVYLLDGGYTKWAIPNDFGDMASVYKTIIATFEHRRAK